MVAGRRVYCHPSCRERHYILEKLSIFYSEHETPIEQVLRDLHEAINWLPPAEYAAEAERLGAARPPARRAAASPATAPPCRPVAPPSSAGRRTGPRPLSAILPELLLQLGVKMVGSSPSGEADPT
jgi:transposase